MFITYRMVVENKFYQGFMQFISKLFAVPVALTIAVAICAWALIKQLFVLLKWMFAKPKPKQN